jgi:hypothetical protein
VRFDASTRAHMVGKEKKRKEKKKKKRKKEYYGHFVI